MKLRTSLSGTEVATAAGVGLVNIAVQELDAQQGRSSKVIVNATDPARGALFGLGHYYKRKGGKKGTIGEALTLSSAPLVLSTLYDAFRVYVQKQAPLLGN